MEKGVLNTYQKAITVTTPEGKDDVVLAPGVNRLSPADYATIKAVPVIVSYFETGLLRDVRVPREAKPTTEAKPKKPSAKPAES